MLPLLNMQAAAADDAEKSSKQQQKMIAKVSISILVMSLPVLYVSFLRIPPATLFRDTTFWFLMSNSIIFVIAADSGMLFFAGRPSSSSDDRPFIVSGELLPPQPMVVAKNQAMVVSELGDVSHALVVARGGQESQEDDDVVVVKPEESTMMFVPYAAATGEVMQAARPRLTASKSVAGNREAERMARRRRRSRSHSHALVTTTAPWPVQEKNVVVREDKLRRTATEGPPEPEEEISTSAYSQLSDEELNRRVEEFIARFNMEIRLQLEKEQEQAAAA